MQNTGTELKQKSGKLAEESADSTHSLVSKPTSQAEIQGESKGLSQSLATSLMGLIREVNKEGVTPETVNASCNAANAIYKILRLNFEMKKEGF